MAPVPTTLEPLFERLGQIHDAATLDRIHASMVAPKRTGYFLNPLVPADGELPVQGLPVAGLEGCFSVSAAERPALLDSAAVAQGAVYPINPSSVFAARCLSVAGQQEVLDLAAAPGGKTLLLAAAMNNRERIAAVEPVKGRFFRMRANLERCGVSNAQFYQADGRSIGRKVPERFDRVLLDAPCSSESRIRLEQPDTFRHWKLRKVKECSRKQRGLIRSAFAALKPGGHMLYCTCSFAPEENERVIAYLLESEPDADLAPLTAPAIEAGGVPGVAGLTSWQGKTLDTRLELCRRVLPDDLWDGFFLASIVKRSR